MKQRIWELDALRGLCILGMVGVHLVYDLVELTGLISWEYPPVFAAVKDWGGVLFLLLSGLCATLGSRSIRRGAVVFACGLLCTAVTWGMYRLGLAEIDLVIWFGVLHCLGVCMLLWAGVKTWPTWILGLLGLVLVGLGLWFRGLPGLSTWVFTPLGLPEKGFLTSDYFPLLPNFGFFLLGSVLGRTLYREKRTLFPGGSAKPLCFVGRHSLEIYLLHQPLLAGICYGLLALKS